MRHKDFWVALGLGALAGAVAALLYAPQSGARTRKQLKRNIADAGEALEDATAYLKAQAEQLGEQAQKLIEQGKGQFSEAVDAANDYAQTVAKAANVFAGKASNTAEDLVDKASDYAGASRDMFGNVRKAAKKKLA